MQKTPRQYMTEFLIKFGRMFQLPEPSAEYIDAIYTAIHGQNWTIKQFTVVLNILTTDEKYTEQSARFGKYPMISDYLRIKKHSDSKPFYDALSAYLSGCFWEKENIIEYASPAQANAIMQAGGLENLYQRATGDIPTPVYKLVDMIAENESETPTELIDTGHRIGKPQSMKQITDSFKDKTAENQEK